MTEEDVKVKLVVPYLKSLGFTEDELFFEKSFTLHFGRNTIRVDTQEQVKEAHPRLDILVKRDGRNLFIIEVKTDSDHLSDGDRDQAISYARLVDPMAPVVIVTNGKDFKLYKTGNKEEIKKGKEEILAYKIGDDLESLYCEALENFIGYSKENVKTFCRTQIEERM